MASATWADRVVLGTWGVSGALPTSQGPAGYGEVGARVFDEVLDAAWAAGVRWVDTAPGYGGGAGLRRLADWERRRGVRWNVAIKPGRPYGDDGPRSDISPAGVRAELRAAPIRDPAAVLVKDPPREAFTDGRLTDLLAGLAREGIGRVGVATHLVDAVAALGPPPVPRALVQMEFNLLNRVPAIAAATAATNAGWRVWGMQPLAYGFLGGRHGATTSFPPDDWRSRMPPEVRRALSAGAGQLPGWLPACARDRPMAEVALAWCLAGPVLERVVVGPRSVAQLRTLDRAAELAVQLEFATFVRRVHRAGALVASR